MLLELNHGLVTQFDECDEELVMSRKWLAYKNSRNTWYVRSRIGSSTTFLILSRLLLNAPDEMVVDHIDGDGLNNARANLRLCTPRQNSQNRRKGKSGSSQFKGVVAHRGKWRAQIRYSGKLYVLGRFEDEMEAAREYNSAARIYFGEFARLNEIGNV